MNERIHMEYTGEDAEEMQGTLCGDGGTTDRLYLGVNCVYCLRVMIMDLRGAIRGYKAELHTLTADFHKPVFSPWFLDKHGTAHREALFGPSFITVHPDGAYHARVYKADGTIHDEQATENGQSFAMFQADACAWRAGWRVPGPWPKDSTAADVAQLPVRSPK